MAESDGATVVLAVTGGIAAYKACEVLRRLQDHGIRVRVAMSRSATRFVGPTTFAALSGEPVLDDLFERTAAARISHVRWADACDALCVAPATADVLAKMATGLADDVPSTLHLAVSAPVLVAPAMEEEMYRHPAVQANLSRLRERGVHVVGPARGDLASGKEGRGRMAEPEEIVDALLRVVAADAEDSDSPLRDRRVLVSAGPTREHIDPVRVLSNPSSGKMGYALAAEGRDRGARVTLVSGPTQIEPPSGVELVGVETARAMASEMRRRVEGAEVVVMAAAVCDYRPRRTSNDKLKKSESDELKLELVANPDILQELAEVPGERLVVGFAAETSDLEARGREKLDRKGCDLMVINQVGPGVGFEADDNSVLILDPQGGREQHGPAPKRRIAAAIWDRVESRLRERERS